MRHIPLGSWLCMAWLVVIGYSLVLGVTPTATPFDWSLATAVVGLMLVATVLFTWSVWDACSASRRPSRTSTRVRRADAAQRLLAFREAIAAERANAAAATAAAERRIRQLYVDSTRSS